MKKMLLTNWGIKVISLLIAFGLWFGVVYFEDPIDDEVFTNIPVQFVNTERLTDQGYVYEVLDNSDVVKRVTVRGPKKALAELKALGSGAIIATADFSEKNMSDVIEIDLAPNSRYAGVITEIDAGVDGALLKLLVEEEVERPVSVRVIVKGEESMAAEHQLGSYKLEQNRISITGGKSKIEQVSYAAVTIDVTGSDSDISTIETIRLYDSENNLVDSSKIEKNIDSTTVNVTVLATKTVPITFKTKGQVAEGYQLTGETSITKETVKIAGTDAALNNVNSITIPASVLDLTEAKEDVVATINLRSYLPSGVQIAKDETETTTTITVEVEPEITLNFKMLSGNVTIKNVPEGFIMETAESHEVYDVLAAGLRRDLDKVQESTLSATVDLKKWMEEEGMTTIGAGTYHVPAQVDFPEGVEQQEDVFIWITLRTEPEETTVMME